MTEQTGGERGSLAPVIPLFGGRDPARAVAPASGAGGTPAWRTTWEDEDDRSYDDDDDFDGGVDDCLGIELEIAEQTLLRKLRTRSLSVSEARAVIAERDLGPADIDGLLQRFRRNGYLDDAALADQLVRSAVERKGQGRHLVAQTLTKRGIPRDVIDGALAALPDDDAERALEFARAKATAMSRLDADTALRRLVGQLSRRGYPSSVSMSAARQALDEQAAPRGPFFS